MRVLLAAAVSLAAAAVPSAGATPSTDTLVLVAHGTISAFAQDDRLIAWFTPDAKGCNAVHVRSVFNGLKVALPKQQDSHNVTCRWTVGRSPVTLAVAGKTSNVLWTLHESSPLQFDYLIGAGAAPSGQHERRFHEFAHTSRGNGLWFGGVAGDGTTLVYAVTSVDYKDEAGCLAGTDSCAMKIAGGGVYRLVGWKPTLVPGTTHGAVAIAAGGGRIAYVGTGSITKRGRPAAGADLPIQVVDAGGHVVSSIQPQGTPIAIGLSTHLLAALERTPLGLRLARYSPASGLPIGSAPVANATSPELTVSDRFVVFHVGRSIRAVEIATGRIKTVISAAAAPVGLSLEGSRLAWAENLKHGARIRALHLG